MGWLRWVSQGHETRAENQFHNDRHGTTTKKIQSERQKIKNIFEVMKCDCKRRKIPTNRSFEWPVLADCQKQSLKISRGIASKTHTANTATPTCRLFFTFASDPKRFYIIFLKWKHLISLSAWDLKIIFHTLRNSKPPSQENLSSNSNAFKYLRFARVFA